APGFELGLSEDRNKRCRRTMEDAHTFVFDYMGVPRQGFFAIFDGHAGKATAEWCGANFDTVLANVIEESKEESVPEILNKAFLKVDSKVNENEGKFSGCTAIVAFVKVKDEKRILYTGNVGDARAVL
ncbi:protein phosphatase 2C, partial [Backusella circina FSU 941]